jgi:ubiquinone/menaquinone biosynthesis C-methylase UbiE
MALTSEELNRGKAHFSDQTTRFAKEGYERLAAPVFILDQAAGLAGPVLDVGTGTGITARALATRGLETVSVDLSADDQQLAAFLTDDTETAGRIHFELANACHLIVPDGHFGAAVLIDVLHHLETGGPVLKELFRVIRPGGLVVLADFTVEGFNMVSRVYADQGLEHPEGPVTVDWARGFLSALGMTEERLTTGHSHRIAVFRKPVCV